MRPNTVTASVDSVTMTVTPIVTLSNKFRCSLLHCPKLSIISTLRRSNVQFLLRRIKSRF